MNVLYIEKYFMSRRSSVLVAWPVYSRSAGVSRLRLSLGCLSLYSWKCKQRNAKSLGNVKSKPLSSGVQRTDAKAQLDFPQHRLDRLLPGRR
jgi:hypothetical protein